MPADAVTIQQQDFDIASAYASLRLAGVGACVVFTGLVRDIHPGTTTDLELEHYPGMTEQAIADIVAAARKRWSVERTRVIHRVGKLGSGDQIVLVGVSSAHRGDAFAACEFIMDFLKTDAPIWKKELADGEQTWVDQKASDRAARSRWREALPQSEPTDKSDS